MGAKQLALSGSLSLSKGLVIRKGEIVQTDDFIAFVTAQKQLQQQIDEGWAMLQDAMEQKGVKTAKGDWGHVTLASRMTLKVESELPPRFYKKQLDSRKVRAYEIQKGHLPAGVTEKQTTYLSKEIRL